jgi:purine-binding chemotaxis protein CheW
MPAARAAQTVTRRPATAKRSATAKQPAATKRTATAKRPATAKRTATAKWPATPKRIAPTAPTEPPATPVPAAITEPAATSHQLVIFALGGEDYALPIAQIKEVIRYIKPRRIASNDPRMTGVITLRGEIVPIGDLSMSLGVSAIASEEAKIIITETAAGTAGIVVDAVDEVLTIESSQIDTTTAVNRDVMCGIAKLGDRLVVLLNVERLLAGIDGSASAD